MSNSEKMLHASGHRRLNYQELAPVSVEWRDRNVIDGEQSQRRVDTATLEDVIDHAGALP